MRRPTLDLLVNYPLPNPSLNVELRVHIVFFFPLCSTSTLDAHILYMHKYIKSIVTHFQTLAHAFSHLLKWEAHTLHNKVVR